MTYTIKLPSAFQDMLPLDGGNAEITDATKPELTDGMTGMIQLKSLGDTAYDIVNTKVDENKKDYAFIINLTHKWTFKDSFPNLDSKKNYLGELDFDFNVNPPTPTGNNSEILPPAFILSTKDGIEISYTVGGAAEETITCERGINFVGKMNGSKIKEPSILDKLFSPVSSRSDGNKLPLVGKITFNKGNIEKNDEIRLSYHGKDTSPLIIPILEITPNRVDFTSKIRTGHPYSQKIEGAGNGGTDITFKWGRNEKKFKANWGVIIPHSTGTDINYDLYMLELSRTRQEPAFSYNEIIEPFGGTSDNLGLWNDISFDYLGITIKDKMKPLYVNGAGAITKSKLKFSAEGVLNIDKGLKWALTLSIDPNTHQPAIRSRIKKSLGTASTEFLESLEGKGTLVSNQFTFSQLGQDLGIGNELDYFDEIVKLSSTKFQEELGEGDQQIVVFKHMYLQIDNNGEHGKIQVRFNAAMSIHYGKFELDLNLKKN